MSKVAFVFPGQGSQVVGMGQDFAEQAIGRSVYETFDRIVDANLSTVCFTGPDEELRRTLYTQPAILATSIAALSLFQEKLPLKPAIVAGHSLGEYGALYAAGVITLETAATLVKQRASLMEAAPKGAMSAVLGLEDKMVSNLVDAYRKEHQSIITVANYNTDNQLVISGAPEAVAAMAPILKEAGAKRVLPLPVGGAFHSPLMQPAAEAFSTYLTNFDFQDAQVPVATNVDAELTTQASELRSKLGRQIDSSVRWTQTMNRLVAEGVDTVIEFGPGKVLTGMFKKMFPDVAIYNVLDMASLDATVSALSQQVTVSV